MYCLTAGDTDSNALLGHVFDWCFQGTNDKGKGVKKC